MLHLSSRNSCVNGTAKSDLSFNLGDTYRRTAGMLYSTVRINSVQLPVSFYLIDTQNNAVSIDGQPYALTLGNYDALSFTTMFNGLISGVVLSIDLSRLQFSLQGPAHFTFSTNLGAILGFENDATYLADASGKLEAPYVCNFGGVQKILITSQILGTGVYGDVDANRSVLCSIPLSSDVGNILSWVNVDSGQRSTISRSSIEGFDIQFRDQNFQLLNFNGADVYFSLLFESWSNTPPPVSLSIKELEALIQKQNAPP